MLIVFTIEFWGVLLCDITVVIVDQFCNRQPQPSWLTARNYFCQKSINQLWASLIAQSVENKAAMQETWGLSMGQEDPPGEANGNPLQYSCLENCMDRGT